MPVARPRTSSSHSRSHSPTRSAAADPRLRRARARIDAIDATVLELLNARAGIALRVGRLKEKAGLPLRAPAREAEVLRQVRGATRGPLPPGAVERIFRAIIAEMLAAERRNVRRTANPVARKGATV